MYKLKTVVRRVSAIAGALGLVTALVGAWVPTIVSADALNPLTSRTLLLTSSSPGWAYLDGSGNSTYAPAGSGDNGQKTGETFNFVTSTNSTNTGLNATSAPIKAFTFQYCTTAAGTCAAPGDDLSDPGGTDDTTHTDLNVTLNNPVDGVNFAVYVNGANSSGWSETTSNLEDAVSGTTGKHNFITLVNTTGIQPAAGTPIKVVFYGTSTNYITNPGEGAFFVKINDFTSATYQNWDDNYPSTPVSSGGQSPTYTCGTDSGLSSDDCPANVADGGVTVANVMNQSIEIQTKVLETMDFSVGTNDPDTDPASDLTGDAHGECDSILNSAPGSGNAANTITLGNPDAEDSLSTSTPYDAISYWRLSSNSANGGTVYYSGPTLHNTEGNAIAPMSDSPTADDSAYAHVGTEQFGLGLETYNGSLDPGFTTDVTSNAGDLDSNGEAYWHDPTLSPLVATDSYGDATGALANGSGPKFAFNASANTTPVPIATEDTQVVDCATGQMRYLADIAATTPAGIYTTAINYLAAPEY